MCEIVWKLVLKIISIKPLWCLLYPRVFYSHQKILTKPHCERGPRGVQSIDFLSKSTDWFLYDRDLRHKRVKSMFDEFQTYMKRLTFSFLKLVK